MKLNKIYNENCLETMSRMDNNFIDLTVTSPPYDNLRENDEYNADFDFEGIAHELYRVTTEGGVVVWVVGDQVIDGSESGTSFKQALYFKDEVGFNLHDTMVYEKRNFSNPSSIRYHQVFEYMFVFTKNKLKKFNPITDRNPQYKQPKGKKTNRKRDGSIETVEKTEIKNRGMRHNIWEYNTAGQSNMCESLPHPAIFPEKLAKDHIISWSNEGGLVYDPFTGSGTTQKMAEKLNRKWIGSEISEEYTEIARERVGREADQEQLF